MLEIANLEVVYHSVVLVLKDISLNVPTGKIVALLGPNGSGKSTTLRAITGLLNLHDGRATKGSIRLEGAEISRWSPQRIVASGVAHVMEGRRIFADLSVEENLLAGGYTVKRQLLRDDIARFYEQFPILGERRHQSAGFLSGGEQQMLAVARALISRPKLLLMDEPSLGLAPQIAAEVVRLIRAINAEGVSVLLVEQNATLALNLAHYGYVMENGRIVLDGTAEELREDEDVREFYLGMGGGKSSYRDVKLYRRRKRWLS
jgi:branched-chain amino acid transport system ATP-binding protein